MNRVIFYHFFTDKNELIEFLQLVANLKMKPGSHDALDLLAI